VEPSAGRHRGRFGFQGKAYVRAWRERLRCERWARSLVRNARAGLGVEDGTPLARLAASDLDDRTAAVELLNLLRPTVAVAWLGTFAALRLAEHPQWRERLLPADAGEERLAFAQEVRRTTPFVPALAGRVRQPAELSGVLARPGQFIVLDVVGVDRDPARYADPETFEPQRFLGVTPGAYDLVPQGGGVPAATAAQASRSPSACSTSPSGRWRGCRTPSSRAKWTRTVSPACRRTDCGSACPRHPPRRWPGEFRIAVAHGTDPEAGGPDPA